MAIVSVDSSSNNHHLQLESIPLVDIRLFSQSELNSLSLCSDEAFDLRRCDDVVLPKIDRSVFNESAGSRKQTYSRLRLAPRKPEITNVGRRRRSAGLLPLPKPPRENLDDPERRENQRIATLLRDLFVKNNSVKTDLIPIDFEHKEPNPQPIPLKVDIEVSLQQQQFPIVVACKEVKKKRGRKRKHELKPNGNVMSNAIVVYENQTMDIVNRNGVAVDVVALAKLQDPFGLELRRRTFGLETEEALLGFLKVLNGQWGSRRKKRKIVDASDFGDALPKGWKLMLSLKRREGLVSLNCRRYISPNGHQFVTCKEVSSFLLSHFGPQDSGQQNSGHSDRNTNKTQKLASESTAGLTCQDVNSKKDPICYSKSPITFQSNDHEKQVALLGVENLAEVQVRDLLECHKCNMTFEEKDAYLQHLLSSHQRSAKRCKLGSSVADGVIVKDGKYECQFCHKIFEERHRYNGHVGIHVRNYVRNLEALPSPITMHKSIPPLSAVPYGVHTIDSSVYINKGSVQDTSTAKPNDELNVGSVHCKPDVNSTQAAPDESNCERMISSSDCKQVTEADKSSIPDVTNLKLNELNVGSPHAKLGAAPILQTPTSGSICELNIDSSHSKQIEEAYRVSIPESSVARIYDGQNICSLCSEQDPSSILEHLSGEPKYEPNVASFQGNLVKEARKECSTETSTAEPNDEQNAGSFHTKQKEVSILKTPTDESNFELNVSSCHGKLIAGASKDSVPETESIDGSNVGALHNKQDETPTGKSNCNLNVISSHNKHDMEASKFKGTLVEKSDKKLLCDTTMADSKLGVAGEGNDVGNDKTSYCIDSGTSLSNQKECSTSETFDGSDCAAVTSIKNDKCSIETEKSSGSCSLVPGNEQICGLEGNMNEVLTSFTEVPKLDEMEKSGNNELESGSGGCDGGPSKNVITEAAWASGEGNGPENGVAESSLPLMQSSGSNDELGSCFGGYDAGSHKNVVTETMMPKLFGGYDAQTFYGSDCAAVASIKNDKCGIEPERSSGSCSLVPGNEQICGLEGNMNEVLTSFTEVPKLDEMEKSGNNELESGSGGCDGGPSKNVITEAAWASGEGNGPENGVAESSLPLMQSSGSNDELGSCFGGYDAGSHKNVVTETTWTADEGNVPKSAVADSSFPLMLSSGFFPDPNMTSDKGADEFCNIKKLENMPGFEELRLDDIETSRFSFMLQQDSTPLPEESMGFAYNAALDHGLDSSVQFEWEAVYPRMAGTNQLTAVCIWCSIEFNHEAVDSEAQSNSIGFMCPACKAKISGQVNVLDAGLPMNSDQL